MSHGQSRTPQYDDDAQILAQLDQIFTPRESPSLPSQTQRLYRTKKSNIKLLQRKNNYFTIVVLGSESILLFLVFYFAYLAYFSSSKQISRRYFTASRIISIIIIVSIFLLAICQSLYIHYEISKFKIPSSTVITNSTQSQHDFEMWKKKMANTVKQYYKYFQYILCFFLVVCASNNFYITYISKNKWTFMKEIGFNILTFALWGIFIYGMRKPTEQINLPDFLKSVGFIVVCAIIIMILFEINGYNTNTDLSNSLQYLPTQNTDETEDENNRLHRKQTFQIIFLLLYVPVFGFLIILYIFLSTSFMNAQLTNLLETYKDSFIMKTFFPGLVTRLQITKTKPNAYQPYIITLGLLLMESIIFGLINIFSSEYVSIHRRKFYNNDNNTNLSVKWWNKKTIMNIFIFMGFHFLLQFLGFYNRLDASSTPDIKTQQISRINTIVFHQDGKSRQQQTKNN
jgi:hypothetical protein